MELLTKSIKKVLTAEVDRALIVQAVRGLGATCCVKLTAHGVAVGVQAVVLLRLGVELLRLFAWSLAGAGVDAAAGRSVLLRHQHRLPRFID